MNKTKKAISWVAGFLVLLALGLLMFVNPTSSTIKPLKDVTVITTQDLGSGLIQIAQERKLFAQFGLRVTVRPVLSGDVAINEMLTSNSSSTVFAAVSEAAVVESFRNGKVSKIISQISNGDDEFRWLVRKTEGTLAPADLKNRRIGVPEIPTLRIFAFSSLVDAGSDLATTNFTNIGQSNGTAELSAGVVDAIPFSIYQQASQQFRSIADAGAYSRYSLLVVNPAKDSIESTIRQNFLRAIIEAKYWATANVAESAGLVLGLNQTSASAGRQLVQAFGVRLSIRLPGQLLEDNKLLNQMGGQQFVFDEQMLGRLIDKSYLKTINPSLVHFD